MLIGSDPYYIIIILVFILLLYCLHWIFSSCCRQAISCTSVVFYTYMNLHMHAYMYIYVS